MGFIDDESLEGIGRSGGEGTGADEEIGNAGLCECAGELALVNFTRRTVLGDVLG